MRWTGGRRRTGIVVALTAAAPPATKAGGPRDAFDDDFVSLGRLEANQGNQNYQIAAGVDLRRYRSVVVWCRRFTDAFGAAPLR